MSFALFIIGCIGASGAFPGSAIGWTTGLGGGTFALMLSLGNFKKRKFELIQAGLVLAAFVTIGALGGMGVLSATQVGWGIVGTYLSRVPLCCAMNVIKNRADNERV